MEKKFSDLSEEQVENFYANLKKFGISPDSVQPLCRTCDHSGDLIIGHQGTNDHIHTIDSVQTLKALVGPPDSDYHEKVADDSFVKYPKPAEQTKIVSFSAVNNNVEELKEQMTLVHHKEVNKALHAYILGDSTKVADYEDHINALHFPMEIAVHAAKDLIISKDKPLIVKGDNGKPVSLVYGTATVEKGGFIEVHVPLTMKCQVFTIIDR